MEATQKTKTRQERIWRKPWERLRVLLFRKGRDTTWYMRKVLGTRWHLLKMLYYVKMWWQYFPRDRNWLCGCCLNNNKKWKHVALTLWPNSRQRSHKETWRSLEEQWGCCYRTLEGCCPKATFCGTRWTNWCLDDKLKDKKKKKSNELMALIRWDGKRWKQFLPQLSIAMKQSPLTFRSLKEQSYINSHNVILWVVCSWGSCWMLAGGWGSWASLMGL